MLVTQEPFTIITDGKTKGTAGNLLKDIYLRSQQLEVKVRQVYFPSQSSQSIVCTSQTKRMSDVKMYAMHATVTSSQR